MKKVFVDGSVGTTGLKIVERLRDREDIELLSIREEDRKDSQVRKDKFKEADIVFLCLPDDAAREAVSLIGGDTVVIDTSTAHRTSEGWNYGFPEIGRRRDEIATSKRIANPGCHASGVIALVAPLMEAGFMESDVPLSITSITGYSGGGKSMIADYEGAFSSEEEKLMTAPRLYGLSQNHKHIPEIVKVTGLAKTPVFNPIVAPFYSGMEVIISLFREDARGSKKDAEVIYKDYYQGPIVRFVPDEQEGGFMSAGSMAGRDDMTVTVQGNDERMILVARFDNLGKGASGAAIQNMNLVLGAPEQSGLEIR